MLVEFPCKSIVFLHSNFHVFFYLLGPHVPISDADQTFLKDWLSGLPSGPSHYCRQVASYQDKKILEPGKVVSNLHKEYKKAAGESSARVVSEGYSEKCSVSRNTLCWSQKK